MDAEEKLIFSPFQRALPKCQASCWALRSRLSHSGLAHAAGGDKRLAWDSEARDRMREREEKYSVSSGSEESGEGSWEELTLRIDPGEQEAVGGAAWNPGCKEGEA